MSEQNPNWAKEYLESYDDFTAKPDTPRGRYADTNAAKLQWLKDHPELWRDKPLGEETQRALFKTMQAVGLYSQNTFFRDVRLGRLLQEILNPPQEEKK